MIIIKLNKLAIISSLGFVLLACSSKAVISPALEQSKPEVFALLPVEYPSSIRRERAEEVHTAVANELRSKGLILLEQDVIDRVCVSPACPERQELINKYGIDAFFSLTLSSVSKNNFLAGYYNSIAGKLTLNSANNQQLIKVEDLASEKGGLLFNTGQVFQGLKSTVENASQSKLGTLSDKFASSLVSKLPTFPTAKALPEQVDVVLNKVELSSETQEYVRICAQGTAYLNAFLFIDKRSVHLRELTPGNYCGQFLLWGLVNADSLLSVELRSPFGITQRKNLLVTMLATCQPQPRSINYSSTQKKWQLSCENVSDPKLKLSCQNSLNLCKDARFEIYTTDASGSAYNRVASLSAAMLANSTTRSKGTYQVLAISPNGARSVPLEVTLQ